MSDHAILSPSGAERWLNCPPSARLEESFPDTDSEAAREGTLAHYLGETILRLRTDVINKDTFKRILASIEADELYKPEMYEYCDQYATFILESQATLEAEFPGQTVLLIEQRLDMTAWIEEGFGTSDAPILSPRVLVVNDFKYGRGVVVSAEDNSQMKVYALGALAAYGFMYDFETVRMVIYQPRVDNYSTFEMSVVDLMKWADEVLKPTAALAYAGQGEFKAGKHCGFCRVRATCRANAEFNLEIARHEFQLPVFLDADEISDILSRETLFTKWISSVVNHALHEAVHNGKKWPDYKLVEGRSNRVITKPEEVAAMLLIEGYPEDEVYQPKKMYGITALENGIGRKAIGEIVGPYIIKPPGKLALVHYTDSRPEHNSLEAARRDFEGYGDDPDLDGLG